MPGENSSVSQGVFNKKIEDYLSGRGRSNFFDKNKNITEAIIVEGLCSGSSLQLLEKLFYDCLNRHYQTGARLEGLLKKVLNNFFKEIEAIIATDDALLNPPIYQERLDNRKLPEYVDAKRKLDGALESRLLIIPANIKEKYEKQFKALYVSEGNENSLLQDNNQIGDYFLTLVELAQQNNILTQKEAEILLSKHIPDLPHFERFISQIFLLQTKDENFIFAQDDVAGKFEQLIADIKDKEALPIPVLDKMQTFMDAPEKLIQHLDEILPNERLVRISLPQHTVAAFRINNDLFYYDSNNDEKKFVYCESPGLFVLKLALSVLTLASANQPQLPDDQFIKICNDYLAYLRGLPTESQSDRQSYIIKSRKWLAEHPAAISAQIFLLKNAIKELEQQDKIEKNSDATTTALRVLPQILGFTWKIYRHPKSPLHKYPTDDELFSNSELKERIKRTDFANETLLIKLVYSNQREVLHKLLIDLKNIPREEQLRLLNHADRNGNTALHIACIVNHIEMVTALLEAGANPNLVNKDGYVPLHLACTVNDIEMATALLEAGANPNLVNKDGHVPLIIATDKNNVGLVEVLVKHHADVNYKHAGHSSFTLSCVKSTNEIFNLLLPHANLNDSTGTPPLFLCITAKKYDYVERLLEQGADANIRLSKNSKSSLANSFPEASALEYAIYCNDQKSVILLLKYGAKLRKNELQEIINDVKNEIIKLFIQFPYMAKGETKSKQLQLLFDEYANPPTIGDLFPTTWRHYKSYARRISNELQKLENKNLNEEEIKFIIEKNVADIPGGRDNLREGEFKKRTDLVLDHFLKTDLQFNRTRSLLI